jgi:ABC-type uncharacterized transport system permease subunit
MTNPDDLMLAALFQDAEDDQAGVTGPDFTQNVMVRVNEVQARRKALVDSLLVAAIACVAVICIVLAPSAWSAIEATLLKFESTYGLSGQSLALIGILVISGFGWAVAVKD